MYIPDASDRVAVAHAFVQKEFDASEAFPMNFTLIAKEQKNDISGGLGTNTCTQTSCDQQKQQTGKQQKDCSWL